MLKVIAATLVMKVEFILPWCQAVASRYTTMFAHIYFFRQSRRGYLMCNYGIWEGVEIPWDKPCKKETTCKILRLTQGPNYSHAAFGCILEQMPEDGAVRLRMHRRGSGIDTVPPLLPVQPAWTSCRFLTHSRRHCSPLVAWLRWWFFGASVRLEAEQLMFGSECWNVDRTHLSRSVHRFDTRTSLWLYLTGGANSCLGFSIFFIFSPFFC